MKLDTIYDKKYIITTYEMLHLLDTRANCTYYDPPFDTFTKINKKKAFLECWREYFINLMPIYLKTKSREESIKQIHLIFGNETSQIKSMLYGNALFFRVAIKTLKANIEKYKKYEQKQ